MKVHDSLSFSRVWQFTAAVLLGLFLLLNFSFEPSRLVRWGQTSSVQAAIYASPRATTPQSQPPVYWTDWTSAVENATNGRAEGTITLPDGSTITVNFTGDVTFARLNGSPYWIPEAPYLSATVPNSPKIPGDIVAQSQGINVVNTVTFSRPVRDVLFAVVSLNNANHQFNVPIEVLSFGAGYWGNGTLSVTNGTTLSATGEGHGTIRIPGSRRTFSFQHTNAEYWTGFTVGIVADSVGEPGPNLAVSKSQPSPVLVVGQDSTYTITVTNSGDAAATTATIKEAIPGGLDLISTSGTNWSCTPSAGTDPVGTITCGFSGGTIAAGGGTSTLNVVVRPKAGTAGTSVTNRVAVDSTGSTIPPLPSTCTGTDQPSAGCGAPVTSMISSVCVPPPANLVAWYRGEGNANDAVGNHHGALQGTVTYNTGLIGQALDLDGTTGYVRIEDAAALKPAQFTLEAWIKPTSFRTGTWNTVLSRGNINGNEDAWFLGLYEGRPSFQTAQPGWHESRATTTATLNQWNHLVATFDGTTKKMYLNGVLVTNEAVSNPIFYENGAIPILIGEDWNNNGPGGVKFHGQIDDARIYSRALMLAEIQAIFQAGSLGFCSPQNTPPTIATTPLTRQQGSTSAVATIAMVSDAETPAGSLTVTAQNVPPGIVISDITNTNGTITAQVAAACTATTGVNSIRLDVTDANGAMATALLEITVTENAPPDLSYAASHTLNLGAALTINPATGPTDNGAVASIALQSITPAGFTGTLTVDNATGIVTINNAGAIGQYTVTIRATDNCGKTTDATFTLTVPSTPPTITPVPGLARQQGGPGAVSVIATVSDLETPAGDLIVTATIVPMGIIIRDIKNLNGTITAFIAAECTARLGDNRIGLQVRDAHNNSTSGDLTVNVTPNTPPVLSYANPPLVNLGGALTINPATGPTDNGTITALTVHSVTPAFTGTIAVHPTTGVVSVSNATPGGTYTVTIRATDNCGAPRDASFVLTVGKIATRIVLDSTPSPSGIGHAVRFTARVRTVPAGLGPPTGNALFYLGRTLLATVPLTQGDATFTTDALCVGTHQIYAAYRGNDRFEPSESALLTQVVQANDFTIHTHAGNGVMDFPNTSGAATASPFNSVAALAMERDGSLLIVDSSSRVVSRVNTRGKITRVAGVGSRSNNDSGDDGPALQANFRSPQGVAVDSKGNIYIADAAANRIRIITPDGIIRHFAGHEKGAPGFSGDGGIATAARFNSPYRLAVDARDNLYVSDLDNHRVRRIDAVTKIVTTVAGNGTAFTSSLENRPATQVPVRGPVGLAFDRQGRLYIAVSGHHQIRRVDFTTGLITTVAGVGFAGDEGEGVPAKQAALNSPRGVAVDSVGNIYIADFYNHRLRMVDAATGKITTLAGQGSNAQGFSGDGGWAKLAKIYGPVDVVLAKDLAACGSGASALFLSDSGNRRARKLDKGVAPNQPPPAQH